MNRKHRTFDQLSQIISKQELENYYITQNNSINATQAYFKIDDAELSTLLHCYNLTMIKAEKYSHKANFDKLKTRITFDLLYEYFIAQKHTINESAAHFGITRACFRRLASEYGIKKDRQTAVETLKRFMQDTYDVENPFQLPEVKTKITKTFVERYGVEHALQNKDFLNKAIDTSISRYGENFRINWSNDSNANKNFASKLDKLNIKYEREFRLNTKFFDFKVGNILVDINPTVTHNVDWTPFTTTPRITKMYHVDKRSLGIAAGYTVISLFDWIDQDKIIKLFFSKKTIIFARQCEVKTIYKKDFAKIGLKDFLNENHIQGYPRFGQELAICLFYEDRLIAVQTWGKPRYSNKYKYELYRQVTDLKYSVIGGNDKMFSYFQKTINTTNESLVSYCDFNLFAGSTYIKNGFTLTEQPGPTRHWVYIGNKINEMTDNQKHFTDNLVIKNGFDRLLGNIFGAYGKGTSNSQLLLEHDYVQVYDCGQATFVWKNNKN